MRPVSTPGWSWFENLGSDLRFAARQLRRTPGFSVTALLTIAIGIGACTAALVFGAGARIVGVGLVLGLAGSVAFARLLQALLFNTRPTDPFTLGAAAALLALVAFLACWIPARRATKVDPMVALRSE